jgi:hypothetical protein
MKLEDCIQKWGYQIFNHSNSLEDRVMVGTLALVSGFKRLCKTWNLILDLGIHECTALLLKNSR